MHVLIAYAEHDSSMNFEMTSQVPNEVLLLGMF